MFLRTCPITLQERPWELRIFQSCQGIPALEANQETLEIPQINCTSNSPAVSG